VSKETADKAAEEGARDKEDDGKSESSPPPSAPASTAPSDEKKKKTTTPTPTPTPTPKSAAERRKKWLLLALSTFLTLLATECGLRLAKRNRAFQPDPDFIRSLSANNPGRIPTWETDDNLNGRSEEIPKTPGQLVTPTNNVGFRMTEDVGPKQTDEKRILLVGDSYTEAYQVPPETRFADITNKRLHEDQATRHWRVLNGGVENGCPSQYSLQLRRWLTEFKPDIVVVALAPNDLSDEFLYERWYGYNYDAQGMPASVQSQTELWILQKSYILRYLESSTLTGSPKLHNIFFPDAQPQVRTIAWHELACQGTDEAKRLFEEKTGKYLLGLRNMVEAAGAKFGVAMVQYLYFFSNEAYYKPFSPGLAALLDKYDCYRSKGVPYQEFVEGFLKRNNIAFRNPYWEMAKAEEQQPKRKLWNFYDYHYSPPGHLLMADALTELVRELIGVTAPTKPAPTP
jgi:hypothetical protein